MLTEFIQLQSTPQGHVGDEGESDEVHASVGEDTPSPGQIEVGGGRQDDVTPIRSREDYLGRGRQRDPRASSREKMLVHLMESVETLRTERRQRVDVLLERIRVLESQMFDCKQEGESYRLQAQEQLEYTQRLQQEKAVLSSQQAALRDQLAAVGDLCRRRGKALQEAGMSIAPGDEKGAPKNTAAFNGRKGGTAAPGSFSIRSAVAASGGGVLNAGSAADKLPAADAVFMHNASQPGSSFFHSLGQQPRDDVLNRSLKSDGPSFDYNDLIPVTEQELDPELLAALHPTEVSAVSQALALTEEVQMLRQQMDEQRVSYEKERARRSVEERQQHRRFTEEREGYVMELQRLEELNECCLRDLVQCHRMLGPQLKDAEREILALKKALMEALDMAEKAHKEKTASVACAENAASTKYKQRIEDMRHHSIRREKEWETERKHFLEVVEEQQRRARELAAALSQAKATLKKETTRFQLEKKGAESELLLMRQSLRQLEKKVYFTKAREEAGEELSLSKYYLA